MAATEGADWVINNDADEFWWPRSGTLKSTLEQLRDEVGVVVAHRSNFVPRPEDGRAFWERMTLRERESLNPLGKPLPPKVAHRADPEITVVQGNHRVEGADPGERLDDGSIEILHFPMRTYAQFENKIAKGGAPTPATPSSHSAPGEPGDGSTRSSGRAAWRPTTRSRSSWPQPDDEGLVEDARLRDHLRELRAGALS